MLQFSVLIVVAIVGDKSKDTLSVGILKMPLEEFRMLSFYWIQRPIFRIWKEVSDDLSPPKHRFVYRLHGAISYRMAIFIATAVKNLKSLNGI
jgi:hypothetical protein